MMFKPPPPSPADKAEDRHAWARLQRARPLVDWDKASLRRADLTGEGIASRVMAGRDDDGLTYVGLVRPGREGPTNPQVLELGRVEMVSLGFYPLERPDHCLALDGSALEGCRPKRGQRGLAMVVNGKLATRWYFNAPGRCFDSTPWQLPAPEPAVSAAALLRGEQFADEAAPEGHDADHEDRPDDHRDP